MAASQDKLAELRELFRRGMQGDQASYALFLSQTGVLCRRAVSRRVRDADLEDVVQEALISIHKARATYDGERPLLPWLLSIVNFRVNDYLRKHYRTAGRDAVDIDLLSDSLSDVTETVGDGESVERMLGAVPRRQQDILTMMHVEGFTAKEVGQKLNMNESAVKVAAHRAMKKIRETFRV